VIAIFGLMGSSHAENAKSDPVLVGAGDIASCDDLSGAEATAKLIENIPGTVFAAGDLAYPDGSDEQFAKCYGPTWGRFKGRTRPAAGNHEYHSDGASGYARYFGPPLVIPRKPIIVTSWAPGTLSF
jgi:acid phosphatase type 7